MVVTLKLKLQLLQHMMLTAWIFTMQQKMTQLHLTQMTKQLLMAVVILLTQKQPISSQQKLAATVADVSLSLTGLNLVHAQDLTIAASYPVSDMLTVGAEFGYVVDTEAWSVGADATYATDMYTLAAAAGFNSAEELSMSASIESTTMIPGATLKLAWEDADYINSGVAVGDGATDNLGSITASASIAF